MGGKFDRVWPGWGKFLMTRNQVEAPFSSMALRRLGSLPQRKDHFPPPEWHLCSIAVAAHFELGTSAARRSRGEAKAGAL